MSQHKATRTGPSRESDVGLFSPISPQLAQRDFRISPAVLSITLIFLLSFLWTGSPAFAGEEWGEAIEKMVDAATEATGKTIKNKIRRNPNPDSSEGSTNQSSSGGEGEGTYSISPAVNFSPPPPKSASTGGNSSDMMQPKSTQGHRTKILKSVIAEGMRDDNKPSGIKSKFRSGNKSLYCVIIFENLDPATPEEITANWYKGEKLIKSIPHRLCGKKGYVYNSVTTNFSPGDYSVEVVTGGDQELFNVDFRIIK